MASNQSLMDKADKLLRVKNKKGEWDEGLSPELIPCIEIRDFFLCSICFNFPRTFGILPNCGHSFCYNCIRKVSAKPGILYNCPICRKKFYLNDIKGTWQQSKICRRLMENIKVNCPSGCGIQLDHKNLIHHENWKCAKRIVQCPYLECKTQLIPQEMGKHLEICLEKTEKCKECNLEIKITNIKEHKCNKELQRQLANIEIKERCLDENVNAAEPNINENNGTPISRDVRRAREMLESVFGFRVIRTMVIPVDSSDEESENDNDEEPDWH